MRKWRECVGKCLDGYLTIRWAFSYFTHSRGSRVLLAGGTMRLPITGAENGCRQD